MHETNNFAESLYNTLFKNGYFPIITRLTRRTKHSSAAVNHILRKAILFTNVMRCAIWYHLYNLKNVKNTHGGVLILLNLTLLHGCFSRSLNCINGTKSRNASQMFHLVYFTFFLSLEQQCNAITNVPNWTSRIISWNFDKLVKSSQLISVFDVPSTFFL